MLRVLLALLLLVAVPIQAYCAESSSVKTEKQTSDVTSPKDKIWPTTQDFYQDCKTAVKTPDTFRSSFCAGYIEGVKIGLSAGTLYALSGVRDGIEQMAVIKRSRDNMKICWLEDIPPPADISLASEYIAWIDKNGEPMHSNAEDSFFRMLQDVHPCKK